MHGHFPQPAGLFVHPAWCWCKMLGLQHPIQSQSPAVEGGCCRAILGLAPTRRAASPDDDSHHRCPLQ